MNSWFTVKVKFLKELGDGTARKVTESYLFAAESFSDAENRAYEEIITHLKHDGVVTGIAKTEFHDIFYHEDSEHWYKVKMNFETTDIDSEKSKKVTQTFLVSGNNVNDAYERIKESLKTLMVEFQVTNVDLSPIVDVFPFSEELDREISRRSLEETPEEQVEVALEETRTSSSWSAGADDEDEVEEEGRFEDQYEEN